MTRVALWLLLFAVSGRLFRRTINFVQFWTEDLEPFDIWSEDER